MSASTSHRGKKFQSCYFLVPSCHTNIMLYFLSRHSLLVFVYFLYLWDYFLLSQLLIIYRCHRQEFIEIHLLHRHFLGLGKKLIGTHGIYQFSTYILFIISWYLDWILFRVTPHRTIFISFTEIFRPISVESWVWHKWLLLIYSLTLSHLL